MGTTNSKIDVRPFLKMNILGKDFKALVDTGAVISLINDDVANFLKSNGVNPERGQYKLSMADNSRVQIVWNYTFKCQIDCYERELKVAHLPSLTVPIILGMDTINPLNLVQLNFNEWNGGEPETGVSCVKTSSTPPTSSTIEENRSRNLSEAENEKLEDFLNEELPKIDTAAGTTKFVGNTIELNIESPFKQKCYDPMRTYDLEMLYQNGVLNYANDDLSQHPAKDCEEVPVYTVDRSTKEEKGVKIQWYNEPHYLTQTSPDQVTSYAAHTGKRYRRTVYKRRSESDPVLQWKLCVPIAERTAVLEEGHDLQTSGHRGVRETSKRIAERYSWPRRHNDVRSYAKKYLTCQADNVEQRIPAGLMHTREPIGPWYARWCHRKKKSLERPVEYTGHVDICCVSSESP